MTRWRLTIEFDGGPFMGWQRQDNARSVQGQIESAIFRMTGERAAVHSAGRTDSGVHALAMSAHVDFQKHFTAHRLRDGLNALVRPDPIAILATSEVADDWHASYSCVGRRYEYRILNRRAPATLERGHVWHIPTPLAADAMMEGAAMLVGSHDFTTFRSAQCQSKSPVKTLDRLEIVSDGEHFCIEAAARSFLHHQVRSMVGCLAMVGRGQWSPGDLQTALDARDRAALGLNAPPDGLYFVEAVYP